jgi:hypothetical protein
MLDITGFVYRQFEPVSTYGSPAEDFRVLCPFCGRYGHSEDIKGHLHIGIYKQAVHCFRCGYSNGWVGFVMDAMGCNYSQALGELYHNPSMADFNRVMKGITEPEEVQQYAVQLPADFQLLTEANLKETRPFRKYLINRGFKEPIWSRYGLGIAESVPGRIIIPIEFDYWQVRSIYKWVTPKYTNPKSPSSIAIFNSAALEKYDEVAICEGAFSAMAIGENAIALVGKESPKEKLDRIIQSSPSTFILALEPEAFGTMHKLADALLGVGKRVILWKYDFGDPAEKGATFQEIEYSFKSKLALMLG